MLDEINAAAEHLVTLLAPPIDAAGFKQQVQSTLEARFAHLWFPGDAARASAARVLLWHPHGGGEGTDNDLWQACFDHCKDGSRPSDFFLSPFTLWIDPGCVAIRTGHGPGVFLANSAPPSLAIKVIYGACHAASLQSMPLPPPVVTLSPSTPMLDSQAERWSQRCYPSVLNHARTPSASSMASSTYTASRSTSWSSYTSSNATDDSEQCPSLVATSTHDSDSELSIEDMIDSGCYKNFDLIDDEDEEEEMSSNVGEDTITVELQESGDVTISAEEGFFTPSKATIINYDGGNVGVLGGGIRLGSSSGSSCSMSSKEPRKPTKTDVNAYYPLHHTTALGQYAPPLPPPNSIHGFEQSLGFPAPPMCTMVDAYGNPMQKRIRSRGRRSRGRGAGRAARRQAAAMQALSEAEQSLQTSAQSNVRAGAGSDGCEDERIMAMVRQRADQVAKDLVRRHLDQHRAKLPMQNNPTQLPFQQPYTQPMTLYHQQQHQPYYQWT